jgi:hypothetical protein
VICGRYRPIQALAFTPVPNQIDVDSAAREIAERIVSELPTAPLVAVMPDANIYDLIAATEGLTARLVELRDAHRLELRSIGLIEEQLSRVRSRAKRDAIALVPRNVVTDGVTVFGHSRWGQSRFGEAEPYTSIKGEAGGSGTVIDAMLAATSAVDRVPLVTHDRRLWRRATDPGDIDLIRCPYCGTVLGVVLAPQR